MFDEKVKAASDNEARAKIGAEIDALALIQKALLGLDSEARVRIMRGAIGYFDIQITPAKPKQTRVRTPKVTA